MKVAFVSQPGYAVLPPAGSLEIWTQEVARRLAERHEVVIYASASPQAVEGVYDGVEYRFVEHPGDARLGRVLRPLWRLRPADRALFSSPFHPFLYWLRVARYIRRRGVDAVHVYNYSQAVPIIRRLNPDVTIALHMQCEWLVQIDRRTIDRRLRRADVVIGCSEHITGAIRNRFPAHAARCRTIYNGVDVEEPAVNRAGDSGTVTLLHVGRISPEKGHHLLVEALNEIVPEHPELRMVFVGEESLIPADMAVAISPDPVVRRLERFYHDSYLDEVRGAMLPQVAERTTFAGRVDHERTAEYYEAADIFVFPSLFEAFPIPPIEAMAAALPVVAARAGGTVESVVDGETGLLVERDDPAALAKAIADLAGDAERRRAFGDAGRARAARVFSWTSVTEEVERALAARTRGTAEAYDEWHRGYDGAEDAIDTPWHAMAIPQLPPLGGLRVLEIGCGRGGISRYLAKGGAEVVAADLSPAAVEITNRMLAPYERAHAVVADVEEIPFPDTSFDLVISLDTVEHVPHPSRAVAELARVTRPGGRIVITTNNYFGLIGLWRLAMKLTGLRFTEEGQPINKPLVFFPRARLMRSLGCRVEVLDGSGHYLRIPRYKLGYLRLNFLERPHALTKWFGTHRLVVATKV